MKDFLSSFAAKLVYILMIGIGGFVSWAMANVVMQKDFDELKSKVSKQENFNQLIYDKLTGVEKDVAYIRGRIEKEK